MRRCRGRQRKRGKAERETRDKEVGKSIYGERNGEEEKVEGVKGEAVEVACRCTGARRCPREHLLFTSPS